MGAKIIFAVCASALLVQGAFSQCSAGLAAPWGLVGTAGWNGLAGPALSAPGLAGAYRAGCGGVASTGGGLPVTSASPIAPTGVSVVSENAYEGSLAAGGNLPFLGTVALEGVVPTAGVGAVSYGCGDGAVGIVAEDGPIFTGIAAPGTYAPAAGLAAPGIGGLVGPAGIAASGLAGPGYNGLAYNELAVYGSNGCGCGYSAIL